MTRIVRIARYMLYIFAGLLAAIVLFLLLYYHWQTKILQQQDADIEEQLPSSVIEADSLNLNPSGKKLNLIPVPKTYRFSEGFFSMPAVLGFYCADSLSLSVMKFLPLMPNLQQVASDRKAQVTIQYKEDLPQQGYGLVIDKNKITIQFSSESGLNYAFVTLKVLNSNYGGQIPCVNIEDYPELKVRGLLLDVSRDKIPTLETLTKIVEILGDLKYNHLELYVEGFSFAYPSFTSLWKDRETPLTGSEILLLDSICKTRYIELVPDQNTFGHMGAWLETEEFDSLAECPDGYRFLDLVTMKTTLDPTDRRSIELVTRMTDDMLPYFKSDKFNANLDEPFELGMGKSRKLVEEKGVNRVYMDYVLKVHEILKARDRKMWMWGDIILRQPEMIKEIPDDITLLDWGYLSDYPFERNCRLLQAHSLDYLVCPGTSSWLSITGLTDNMVANIASAAGNASKYNAEGLLLADWGDMGHWQYLPVSYAGYATAASYSWNPEQMNEIPLAEFLNTYFFGDSRGIMGNLVLDLGRYQQFEEMQLPNMTSTMLSLQFGLQDRIVINATFNKLFEELENLIAQTTPELLPIYRQRLEKKHALDFIGLMAFLEEKQSLLVNTDLHVADSALIKAEYLNAIKLLKTSVGLQYFINKKDELTHPEKIEKLKDIRLLLQEYLTENQQLWETRYKPGGYKKSTKALNDLLKQLDSRIKNLEKPFYVRLYYSVKERLVAASKVFYLKTFHS